MLLLHDKRRVNDSKMRDWLDLERLALAHKDGLLRTFRQTALLPVTTAPDVNTCCDPSTRDDDFPRNGHFRFDVRRSLCLV